MHTEKFQKLEGSWRVLHHLVFNSETNDQLKIRVLDITKKELSRDLSRAIEYKYSQTFKKIYEGEICIANGVMAGARVLLILWVMRPKNYLIIHLWITIRGLTKNALRK